MSEISTISKELLITTTQELIEHLKKDETVANVKMLAFLAYLKDSEEEIQIQVIVTRSPHDFIEPFETVIESYED